MASEIDLDLDSHAWGLEPLHNRIQTTVVFGGRFGQSNHIVLCVLFFALGIVTNR